MSIKNYYAYRLKRGIKFEDWIRSTIEKAKVLVKSDLMWEIVWRAIKRTKAKTATLDTDEKKGQFVTTLWNISMELRDRFQHTFFDPQIHIDDFNLAIWAWLYKGRYYIRWTRQGDLSRCLEWLEESPDLEHYGYWDNTDQPEDVTDRQWRARRKTWLGIWGENDLKLDKKTGKFVRVPATMPPTPCMTFDIVTPEVSVWTDLTPNFFNKPEMESLILDLHKYRKDLATRERKNRHWLRNTGYGQSVRRKQKEYDAANKGKQAEFSFRDAWPNNPRTAFVHIWANGLHLGTMFILREHLEGFKKKLEGSVQEAIEWCATRYIDIEFIPKAPPEEWKGNPARNDYEVVLRGDDKEDGALGCVAFGSSMASSCEALVAAVERAKELEAKELEAKE